MTDSKKLDLLLSKIVTFESKFETLESKFDTFESKFEALESKIDTTKLQLITRMDDMKDEILNTCLGYTDDQNESIIKKLNNIQSTINTASRLKTIDNDIYNIVNSRIDNIEERVNRLEKIS